MPLHRTINTWTLLLFVYSVLLAYGSLYPLPAWQSQPLVDLSFLWAPWPRKITRIDLLTNLFIYVPFGIVATRAIFLRHFSLVPWLSIIFFGAVFSTSLECLQLFVPNRVASNVDILANTAGVAIGSALSPFFSSRSRFFALLVALRRYWFRPGWIINLGLILLMLWVLAQFSLQKPGLVGGGLHGGFTPFWENGVAQFRPGVALLFALEIASLSLFISVLLRPEQRLKVGATIFTLSAILIKFLIAALLIKLAFLVRILSLEILLGLTLGAGSALAIVYFRSKPPPYPLLAGVLCALVLIKLLDGVPFLTSSGQTPDLATQPELLFNIGGIAYLVAELWPYLVLGCTLALWDREK